MIFAKWLFNSSWILEAGLFLLLNLGSFATVVMSVTTFVLAARWFNLDRLRTFAQFLLVSINLGMMGLSILSATEVMSTGSISRRFSFASVPSIKLLPSAEHVTMTQMAGLGMSMVITVLTTIGYVTVVSVYGLFEYLGLAVGAIGLMMLIVASYWLDRGAASRLRKLEYGQ